MKTKLNLDSQPTRFEKTEVDVLRTKSVRPMRSLVAKRSFRPRTSVVEILKPALPAGQKKNH